jgi:hypothetical protein
MRRITWKKFKGPVDWTAKHAAYVVLWNQRQNWCMYYLSSAMNRTGPYKEYLRWLHLQSRIFLKPAYTEEHIAQLSDSNDDNEINDEFDAITRQGTQQSECGSFQNYVVRIFSIFSFFMLIEIEVCNID